MSTVFQTITNILPSNTKDEEQKGTKIESLGRDLRKNADIAEDLSKEISKNESEIEDISSEKMKGDIDHKDACEKCDSQIEISNSLEKDDPYFDCVSTISTIDEISSSDEKQQLPRSIEISAPQVERSKVAEVKILRLTMTSPGRPDIVLPIPFPTTTSKATLFTLKEGSKYGTKFHFTVSNNPVNCLTYTYMVWKSGIRVHQTKKKVGSFSPRQEPYVYELEEGTTPTGFFARGPFLVKSKFVDDDGKCYLDTTYYFDIRKDWGAREKC